MSGAARPISGDGTRFGSRPTRDEKTTARIAERLLLLDVECRYQVSVLDDRADMEDAFRRASERSDLVLVSGGLGPTRDDMTTEVLAATFGLGLELHESSLEEIRSFFAH